MKSTIDGMEVVNAVIIDHHEPVFDAYMIIESGTFSLTTATSVDDMSIAVDTTAISDGDVVDLTENALFFQAIVLSGGGTNTLTLDTPLDSIFSIAGALGRYGTTNLAVDGSTPVIGDISTAGMMNSSINITRVLFHIEDGTAMDDALFGGISALPKGVVLRWEKNIFNVKTNGDFSERAFDIQYDSKAPSGVFGFKCRRTFGGQSKNGVTVRLNSNANDVLQMIIQDDLTDLNHFHVIVQGHISA